MNILIVLTSHDRLGDTGAKTGFWLEEFASPFYVLTDAGANVVLASPNGGQPPLDPKSNEADFQTDATRRFDHDDTAKALLADTHKLSNIKAQDFDAVFFPGGHGPMWDLYKDTHSIALVEAFIASEKPVAAVCHASAVLLNAKQADGSALVRGKRVTGFSNSEEAAVELTEVVPFLLQDELIAQGGEYQKSDDWHPFTVRDGLLITGQNPASSDGVATALLEALR